MEKTKGITNHFNEKEKVVLYVHGKGGNAGEAEYYRKFFPEYFVF